MMIRKSFIGTSLLTAGMLLVQCAHAQELYVFTEPASNMPAKSISAKITGKFVKNNLGDGTFQRYAPEVMFGVSSDWMIHLSPSFSNMYTSNLRWESKHGQDASYSETMAEFILDEAWVGDRIVN